MTKPQEKLRCAIYTRKSTEEGLEQDFNTLDAQRASCEAYVLSQTGEGWEAIETLYDDGGWSGGNMDRPAIKRLLTDIVHGRIDIVVVYKVDRLTRSLIDFARMVETFDTHKVSFVSVTQSFNTTSSMGRLTLNVLLSFAQFEREVTGERIRDKIAASKARGMWMGGNLPLGYDVMDRKLHIVPNEAEQVRLIFTRYLALGSVTMLAGELVANGINSKCWTSSRGNKRGGLRISCGALCHILKNRLYVGDIVHKGLVHRGDHEAIIALDQFEEVQASLASHSVKRAGRRTKAASSPLTGKLIDANGHPMGPTFGYGRGKKIYRYYASHTLMPHSCIDAPGKVLGQRVSAERLERLVIDHLQKLVPGVSVDILYEAVTQVACIDEKVKLELNIRNLLGERSDHQALTLRAQIICIEAELNGDSLTLCIDARPLRRGKTQSAGHVVVDEFERQQELASFVRSSHRKLAELNASPLFPDTHVNMTAPVNDWSRDRIATGLLAPDIQKAILGGLAPPSLKASMLVSRDLPLCWKKQREMLGFTSV